MIDDAAEFPSPSIVDSRRLLGANVFDRRPGALLEVTCDPARADALYTSWANHVATLRRALDLTDTHLFVRSDRDGAGLFMIAPIDVLMTATEVNEQAWVAAESALDEVDEEVVIRLRAAADAERRTRPNLAAVYDAAAANGISANFDDESLCLGSGVGARSWPFADLPPVADIPWGDLGDAPIALVTGSNGKTTTTRLVAAMWRAAGRVAGWCCSDGVWVDDQQLEAGDYSGPAGAREVLRHPRVDAAILETARGGMLRRGLAVTRALAAIITNISEDHLEEHGVGSLTELAAVKAVVAYAVSPGGRLVLNADDPYLVALATRFTMPISWFSSSPENALVEASSDAATVVDERLMLRARGVWHDVGRVADMPLTLGGAAAHNVANLLGACLVGAAMGVPLGAIRETAVTFGASPGDNPGRLQVWRFGGATVLTDYAHNPDGLAVLCKTAEAIPARRRLLILGQAGNRGDESLRALPRAAFEISHFDRVIIKEMATMLRGRAPGEIPRILSEELVRLGMPADHIDVAPSEVEAVRRALSWASDGDLLVCPVHVSKVDVFALLNRMRQMEWTPGAQLP